MKPSLYVGLMSGTSVDGIDCALLEMDDRNFTLRGTHSHPMDQEIRARIAGISHSSDDEIERMGRLDRELGLLFARATLALLEATNTTPDAVTAIGSHGQTIRHRPPSATDTDDPCFTLQIGDPNTIAEITGITTVADFRRRDVAAGGEGAPLAPAFHAAAMASDGINRAIVNIGGIANISLLQGKDLIAGFDTGPGNTLLDHWIARHRGDTFDRDGAWAASGEVTESLMARLMDHPYFELDGPRSTGKEAFNLSWLDTVLEDLPDLKPVDVQASLAQFTVDSIAHAVKRSPVEVTEIYICGGGAHNVDLMARLEHQLAPQLVASTAALGIDPDWVEAATFAWLAARTLNQLPGNAPAVTGASGPRILGAIHPGP